MINKLAKEIYENNIQMGWWKKDPSTGEILDREPGLLIALIHSEISEAALGHIQNINDDHLPNRPMIEVELADCVIRMLDLSGHYKFDIDATLAEYKNYESIFTIKKGATVLEMLSILHLDVSNALEGFRKNKFNENLPYRKESEVRISEAVKRAIEISRILDLDLWGAIEEKREYNKHRADHKIEARMKEGGKAF